MHILLQKIMIFSQMFYFETDSSCDANEGVAFRQTD